MATVYVSQVSGLDANPGTQASPKQTVAGAMAIVASGDFVEVEGGTYVEGVTVPASQNLTIRAKTGQRPVLEGGGTRSNGVRSGFNISKGLRVEGFEIRNFTSAGVSIVGQQGILNSHIIRENFIHHINGTAIEQFGIRSDYGGGCDFSNNEIGHIGRGGEAQGIRTERGFNNTMNGNTIYFARKSGIRDRVAKNSTCKDNRIYACWTGLEMQHAVGGLYANNVLAWNQNNAIAKHTNDVTTAAGTWGAPVVVRFVHNTCYAASHCGLNLGSSDGNTARYFEARNNMFSGLSNSYIWRGNIELASLTLDYNVYDSNFAGAGTRIYKADYSTNASSFKTLSQLQTDLGLELNGIVLPFDMIDPANWNFDYLDTSLIASGGATLDTAYGDQVGARGIAAPRRKWTKATQTAVSKNFAPTRGQSAMYDFRWLTKFEGDATFPQEAISDLGAPTVISHAIWIPHSHGVTLNGKGYKVETSDDNVTYTTETSGNIPDNQAADVYIELPATIITRYIKFSLTSNFGSTTLTGWSDLVIGDLDDPGAPPPIGGGGGGEDPDPGGDPDPDPGPGGTPNPPLTGAYWGVRS